MEGRVLFKGKQSYLEVLLEGKLEFEQAYSIIRDKLEAGRNFFAGSACVKVMGGTFTQSEIAKLDALFKKDYGIITTQFLSLEDAENIKQAEAAPAENAGQAERGARKPRVAPQSIESPDFPLDLKSGVVSAVVRESVFVRETVRSGQKITSKGDILVLGDVNSGAQLIANGSIIVMGSLRGIAHAGAGGDETATVSAFRLAPLQLRICEYRAIAPEDDLEVDFPETAQISDGGIVVYPIGSVKKSK